MKRSKIRKRITGANAFRLFKGLGLTLPLLLAGRTALATLDLGPAADADVNGNVQGTVSTLAEKNWKFSGSDARVVGITRRPEIFRELPYQREQSGNFPAGVSDTPFLPEPSTVMAASLLLLPLGASMLRKVRKSS